MQNGRRSGGARTTEVSHNLASLLRADYETDAPMLRSGRDGFSLPQTAAIFAAIQSCWAPGTFIPELAHRFWRLNLQVRRPQMFFPLRRLQTDLDPALTSSRS